MASPLVGTKLFVPPLQRTFVPRARVDERLGGDSRLTLVCAPAGFGKTTALAARVALARAEGRSVAWLSCEPGEQQAALFWAYVVATLQTVEPSLGEGVLPALDAAPGEVEAALTTLVNDLGDLPYHLDLVLDDYHLAESPEVARGVGHLLAHLPPNVRLVISTRVDPDLPLARLRARGELREIRADDLRFTGAEVTAYLGRALGFDLDSRDVDALEERTEGWVAALQLAALSMRGRSDPSAFVAGFRGDDRYVVDYLVDEVLARQREDVRSFLLRTSLLDRLTGSLCDAVTGRDDGRAVLASLERANLFVVPLDDKRRWYRYHHLFADVLQTHLQDEHPGEVPSLHRRASDWYAAAAEPVPAVRHALAAGDVDRAAELVELAIPGERRDRHEGTVLTWLEVIPPEVVRSRPVLAMGFISALMARNEVDTVPVRLDDLERLLAEGSSLTVVDGAELARVPASIELYRAALALLAGDGEGVRRHAGEAVALAPAGDDVTSASASALSGLVSWGAGDLGRAHREYTACRDGLERSGHLPDVLGCSITLAEIRLAQGRIGDAGRTYQRALDLSRRQPEPLRGTADMHVGLSQVALLRGRLDEAREHLQQALDLGEPSGLPQHPYRWRVALAGIREAEGDLVAAHDLLVEAERVYQGDFNPDVHPVPALRARLLVALGRVGEARRWVQRSGLSMDDEVSYLRECEQLALARVLLAVGVAEDDRDQQDLQGQKDLQGREDQRDRQGQRGRQARGREARHLLRRLLAAAEEGDRAGSVIEVLVLLALAEEAGGDPSAGTSALARALALAEPEDSCWVFVREGKPLRVLLRRLGGGDPDQAHLRHVLELAQTWGRVAGPVPTTSRGRVAAPVEHLSRREDEILRLLATDLSGPDIARALVVSVNTVRTHTRNIYAKLGVTNRRAAVRRAGELDLLSERL